MTYTYTYGNTQAATGAGLIGLGLTYAIITIVISLAVCAFAIVVGWKLFTKAGKEGWKSIIPFYNFYTMCEIVGISPWWTLIIFVGCPIVALIPIIGALASWAASVYCGVLMAKSTANAFGKDTGFAVGLFFLPLIFGAILAFGDAKYEGAKPMNDIIFKKK